MTTATILIVDDSLTVRMDLAEAFAAAGFDPLPCSTAAEARAAMSQGHVSLAVLDVLLPDGDGIALLEELRAAPGGAQTGILMLSSEREVKDRLRGLRHGADDYVGKPYDRGYVVARARELLQRSRTGPSSSGPRVLLIDDSATLRSELGAALEAAGYDVATAGTGEDGLQLAAASRPAAVIVDGLLPGIDGATVIRRMRLDAALRSTPCILLTGSGDRSAELEALDAGADAFVRKGDDPEVVLARLAAVLRNATASLGGPRTSSLLAPKRILAADDSETFLQQLGEALREEGYDAVLVHSGEAALEMLAIQPADCILLDLIMPGLGGSETCRRIKAAPVFRDIPLIILSAVEERQAMIEGLSIGADDYIPKSSDFEVLKARVRAQIRRRQFEDENRRIREELLCKEMEASEARAARELAETRAALAGELELKNRELEAFSYSVSHDLRAPLRTIDGFSLALLEDCFDRLDEQGKDYLGRIRTAAGRMAELIDDLLQLSRMNRAEVRRERIDLSALARSIAGELARKEPERQVEMRIAEGLEADADIRLLQVALENLLGNAWKFTARVERPCIELATVAAAAGESAFFIRDNGAGFEMAYAQKLFVPFQRLHSEHEFPGTGIGLAIVQRVVDRHGGRIWAEGAPGQGATFSFTLPDTPQGASD